MKWCQRCGASNNDQASFCVNCGAPFHFPGVNPAMPSYRKQSPAKIFALILIAVVILFAIGGAVVLTNSSLIPGQQENQGNQAVNNSTTEFHSLAYDMALKASDLGPEWVDLPSAGENWNITAGKVISKCYEVRCIWYENGFDTYSPNNKYVSVEITVYRNVSFAQDVYASRSGAAAWHRGYVDVDVGDEGFMLGRPYEMAYSGGFIKGNVVVIISAGWDNQPDGAFTLQVLKMQDEKIRA